MFVPDQGKNKMDSKGYNIVFKLLIITVFALVFFGFFIIYKTAEERHIRNFLEYEKLQTQLVANNLEKELNHILNQHLISGIYIRRHQHVITRPQHLEDGRRRSYARRKCSATLAIL